MTSTCPRGGSRCRPGGLLAAAALAGLPACASYPERTGEAFAAFQSGGLRRSAELYADGETTGSAFLSGAEAGMAWLAAGEWQRAQASFDRAAADVRDLEERALVSAERLGEGLLSWTLNESFKSYQGEGYERVMLHAALAQTYLALGSLDGVWVEVRRANALLEREEELYEKGYRAGGLGHFLSAVAYELLGQHDEAYIDYARMEEKGVGVELAGKALVRLSARLSYGDELERWRERYGDPPAEPEGSASVVVIAGLGLGPFKRENVLAVPTPDGLLKWSVPSFSERIQPSSELVLRSDSSGALLRTSVLEDVGDVARENLDDRIAWLAAKSTVRTLMKRELTEKLQDEHGFAGRIAGDLFTWATERADLRAWQTLPDTWQGGRLHLAPGEHELSLEAPGCASARLGRFRLQSGETVIVIARTVGDRLYAHAIGGERLDAAAPEANTGEAAPASDGPPRP